MGRTLAEELRSCAKGIGLRLLDQAADRIEELEEKQRSYEICINTGGIDDLLDWKRRALDAEAKLRKAAAVLVEGIDVRSALEELASNPEAREKVAAEMEAPKA